MGDGKDRAEEIAALLRHAGKVSVVDNIQATKWMKLVSNATTLVSTALFGVSIHEGASDPEARELMLRSGQEALDTGRRSAIPILPIFGLTDADVAHSNRVVELLLETLLKGFTLPSTKTTVLQDWMKGRHSEVNDLNGTVVAEAKRLGLNTPVNAAIVEMALEIERGRAKPLPSNIAQASRACAGTKRWGRVGRCMTAGQQENSAPGSQTQIQAVVTSRQQVGMFVARSRGRDFRTS